MCKASTPKPQSVLRSKRQSVEAERGGYVGTAALGCPLRAAQRSVKIETGCPTSGSFCQKWLLNCSSRRQRKQERAPMT